MEKYQIFISYRRDGGDALAGRLADRFNALGYKVFYDVESMRSGTFNTQILEAVAQCDDVLLVLPANALDRCVNADDWVRQELAFAIKHNKNIIPIMMRGFEFPASLPADIDKIRYMEGVTASSEYFDAVIERIEKLLTAKPVNFSIHSKYQIFEDPEFPEEDIGNLVNYLLLKDPIPEDEKESINNSMRKYHNLHYSENYEGLAGRNILYRVQYGEKAYEIYDVFHKDEKKYAYGLEVKTNPTEQQIGVFFSIDEADNIAPILTGGPLYDLFFWYITCRRGLGIVPDVLLPHFEKQFKALFSSDVINDYRGVIGKDVDDFSSTDIDNTLEYIRAINTNLMYAHVHGNYHGIGVYVSDGNCYGNSFQGYYAGKRIRTPIRKKLILDIVPTKIENHYIALAYARKRSGKLLEGPEYYLISKGKGGVLDFDKIDDRTVDFWCQKYYERFALIYMQVKLQMIGVFKEE